MSDAPQVLKAVAAREGTHSFHLKIYGSIGLEDITMPEDAPPTDSRNYLCENTMNGSETFGA